MWGAGAVKDAMEVPVSCRVPVQCTSYRIERAGAM